MLGEHTFLNHEGRECGNDPGTNFGGSGRSHHLPAQRQSFRPQRSIDEILPIERGRNRPHVPPSIPSNAFTGANLRFHQQGDDYLNLEI